MASSILRLEVRASPAVDRISADGELDIASSRDMWDALERIVTAGRATELDLSRLRFCDLYGVRLLRDAAAVAAVAGLAFHVSGVQGEVARVLTLLGVDLP